MRGPLETSFDPNASHELCSSQSKGNLTTHLCQATFTAPVRKATPTPTAGDIPSPREWPGWPRLATGTSSPRRRGRRWRPGGGVPGTAAARTTRRRAGHSRRPSGYASPPGPRREGAEGAAPPDARPASSSPTLAASTARRPRGWPRTSDRSSGSRVWTAPVTGGMGGQVAWPRRTATSWPSVAARTSAPRTRAASRTSHCGTTKPNGGAASAGAIMPRDVAERAVQPELREEGEAFGAVGAQLARGDERAPTAMGRSRPAPPLRTPDGARFTTVLRRGQR
jgi:hypothetical protein